MNSLLDSTHINLNIKNKIIFVVMVLFFLQLFLTGCQSVAINQSQQEHKKTHQVRLNDTDIVDPLEDKIQKHHMVIPEAMNSEQAKINTKQINKLLKQQPVLKAPSNNETNQTVLLENTEPTTVLLTDLFNLEHLNVILNQAFESNPDLQKASLAYAIANQNLDSANSKYLPTISGKLGVDKTKDVEAKLTASLNASWEIDIWQKYMNGALAQEAKLLAYKADLQGIKDALAGKLIQQYLTIIKNKQLLATQQQRVKSSLYYHNIIEKRFRRGTASLAELQSAQSSHLNAKLGLPTKEKNLYDSKQKLINLVGIINPKSLKTLNKQIDDIGAHYPTKIMTLNQFPKQDLARRPDLQKAFFDIRSAEFNKEVAYKNLLPNISLSATLSNTAKEPLKLLSLDPAWNLLGQLTAPIFNRTQLNNQTKIAEMQVRQSYWSFQQQLLNAVTAVSNAQTNEINLQQKIKLNQQLQKSYLKSLTRSKKSFRLGNSDFTQLLETQMKLFDSEEQTTELMYSYFVNRINLGLELGLGVS